MTAHHFAPMAPTASRLTIDQYDLLYGHESGWEFRSGEAIRKPVPTFPHGVLAALLCDLLRLAGYFVSVEVDIRLTDDWSSRPDVCGFLSPVEGKYPTFVDVVIEVLSEKEDILTKCHDYAATGEVGQVFVFDTEAGSIQTWNGSELVSIVDLLLANSVTITGARIWGDFDTRMKEKLMPPTSMRIE